MPHTAGFPLSAAADLEMSILDLFESINYDTAKITCAGNEDTFAECSVTFIRKATPVDFVAVSCIGELGRQKGELVRQC